MRISTITQGQVELLTGKNVKRDLLTGLLITMTISIDDYHTWSFVRIVFRNRGIVDDMKLKS